MHLHFFFSSRRRHTRWPRDWSSDVCSSDLSILDLSDQFTRSAVANNRCQYTLCFVTFPGSYQITWRFGDSKQTEQEERGWKDLNPEHPLPGIEPSPEECFRTAGRASDDIVAQKGTEETDNDHQLLK